MPPILTPETAEALATSLDVRPELLQYPVPIETGWCIHCFRVAVREWDETEWVRPFKVNCIRNTVTSKRCQRCFRASDKCELIYEGIRGHGFELHALLEWVREFWINEGSGIGETDDAGLVHDMEVVRAVAKAVRDLCSGLDCLIKSHGAAQNLVRKRGPSAPENASYIEHCLSERQFLELPPPLNPRSDGTPHPKRVQFEHSSRQHLRLSPHADFGLAWYHIVLRFKHTIEELIRDEFDHSDPNIVTWYNTMLVTFPLTIPVL
ncbi:hypothetical protein N7471_000420 [Penicillium samsonianum]|uniref:uncharacterized protein n=1 Tax=Penicillium samsonianum TaxID=1882272 RepID=UPI002546F5C3|nr:uncharacterized protein N7471_000420 [Penicillium samsonianum]KAJ6149221.1 hypothetical protein N7471_000420 [Penicillium samsonianum]